MEEETLQGEEMKRESTVVMTKTGQKRCDNRQRVSVGGWQESKYSNVG